MKSIFYRLLKFFPFFPILILGQISFVFSQASLVCPTTNKPQAKPWNKVHALVCGISKYVDSVNIPNLNFAHLDARAFFSLVNSGNVFGNIGFVEKLENQEVTSAAINQNLVRIRDVAQSGDLVIFYFSGHGNSDYYGDPYLLTWQTTSDINTYHENAFQVSELKKHLGHLSGKGCKVLMITDACRDNEKLLQMGQSIQNSSETDFGGWQISSTSQNSKSFEGTDWGGGRGVFTYYLEEGLCGKAEGDRIPGISLMEISNYVEKNVMAAKPNQVPFYCCQRRKTELVALPDSYAVKKLEGIRKEVRLGDFHLAAKNSRNIYSNADLNRLVIAFKSSIASHQYLGTSNSSGVSILARMKPLLNDKLDFVDYQDDLVIAMGNEIDRIINLYLAGKDVNYVAINRKKKGGDEDINLNENQAIFERQILLDLSKDFQKGSELCLAVKALIGPNNPYFKTLHEKSLLLSARSNANSSDEKVLKLALSKCDSALKLNSKNVGVWLTKYMILNNLGDNTYRARQCIMMAHKLAPEWKWTLHALGNYYASKLLDDSACFYYRKSLVKNPTFIESIISLSKIFREYGIEDSSAKYAKIAYGIDKLSIPSIINYTKHLQEFDTASYIIIQPDTSKLSMSIGVGHIDSSKLEVLLRHLRMGLRVDSCSTHILNEIGEIYSSRRLFTKAFEYFARSIVIDSLNPQTLISFSCCLIQRENCDNDPLVLCNDSPFGKSDKTPYLDSAIFLLRKALPLVADKWVCLNLLANAYRLKSDFKSSIYYYNRLLKLDPTDEYVCNKIAMMHLEDTRNLKQARIYLKKIIKVNNENGEAWDALISSFIDRGRKDSALYYVKKSSTINYKNPYNWILVGDRYFKLHDVVNTSKYYRKAADSFLKYIKKPFEYDYRSIAIDVLYNFGVYYKDEKKDLQSARFWLMKSIELDPRNCLSLQHVGDFYYSLSKYDSSLIYYKKSTFHCWNSYFVWNALAETYLHIGRIDSAVSCYTRSIRLMPINSAAIIGLGNIYDDQGLHDSSTAVYKKLISAYPKWVVGWYKLGLCFQNRNAFGEAASHLKVAYDISKAGGAFDEGYVDVIHILPILISCYKKLGDEEQVAKYEDLYKKRLK